MSLKEAVKLNTYLNERNIPVPDKITNLSNVYYLKEKLNYYSGNNGILTNMNSLIHGIDGIRKIIKLKVTKN